MSSVSCCLVAIALAVLVGATPDPPAAADAPNAETKLSPETKEQLIQSLEKIAEEHKPAQVPSIRCPAACNCTQLHVSAWAKVALLFWHHAGGWLSRVIASSSWIATVAISLRCVDVCVLFVSVCVRACDVYSASQIPFHEIDARSDCVDFGNNQIVLTPGLLKPFGPSECWRLPPGFELVLFLALALIHSQSHSHSHSHSHSLTLTHTTHARRHHHSTRE